MGREVKSLAGWERGDEGEGTQCEAEMKEEERVRGRKQFDGGEGILWECMESEVEQRGAGWQRGNTMAAM